MHFSIFELLSLPIGPAERADQGGRVSILSI